MEKTKIILDCDPGHDDAVAILLAAKDPGLQVLGITVVAGNQTLDNTQRNARHVLQWIGSDIPVYAGCGRPLVREKLIAADIHGSTGLDGPLFPPLVKPLEEEHAVPMTNLALALRLEPRIAEKIRRIVLMGGSYTNGNVTPAAEFNILADAEAAQICFSCGRPITMIGLDVTRKVLCYPRIVERMKGIQNAASELFVSLMGHFCRTQREIFGWEGGPLHDPVTIASLIDPTLLTTKPMNVQIDLRSTQSYGRTNCDYFGYLHLPPTADVAVDIDVERFWDIIEAGLRRYSEEGERL